MTRWRQVTRLAGSSAAPRPPQAGGLWAHTWQRPWAHLSSPGKAGLPPAPWNPNRFSRRQPVWLQQGPGAARTAQLLGQQKLTKVCVGYPACVPKGDLEHREEEEESFGEGERG